MIVRASHVVFAALLLGACAQPPPAPAPSKSPSIGNPQAMAAAQAAMGVQTADHPGKAVYERVCAACHNNPEATRSPSLDTLKGMRYQTISYALTQGKMQVQASALSAQERSDVIDFLVGREVTRDDWVAKAMCPASRGKMDLSATPSVIGFGFDQQNHRHLSAEQAGLRTQDMSNLELAWAFAFPKATAMRAQPAIVGKMLFMPVPDSARLFAIDIGGPPCVRWVYENQVPLRTSAGFGELPGSKRKVLVFGDLGANVHMVDALTGKQIWVEAVGLHPLSLTTGTPVLHEDRVYVPDLAVRDLARRQRRSRVLQESRRGEGARCAHRQDDLDRAHDGRCEARARSRRRQDAVGSVRRADLDVTGDRREARRAVRRHR
jgi:polyvinyl alcohol dehydrogenase (cytochrome)